MSQLEQPEFDYESYEKSLALVLDQASKDYWTQHIDINRHQIMVGRTYLWVSAALLGSYFTILTLVNGGDAMRATSVCFLLLSGGAVALSAIAFGTCLYALPGRRGYIKVNDGWRSFVGDAYRNLESQSQSIYRTALTDLIEKFDIAAEYGRTTNATRARWLRTTSWLLIGSFSLAVFASIALAVETFLKIGG